MPDEKVNSGNTSLELFIKLFPIVWPVVVVVVILTFGYGKRDASTDILITQNAQLQTKIDALITQLNNLSQRVATLEGAYNTNQEKLVQEQLYRDRTSK